LTRALRRLGRLLLRAALVLLGLWAALVVGYRWIDPPGTPLMLLRLAEGHGIDRRSVRLGDIAPALPRAVVAAEDNLFCSHHGIDWAAVSEAVEEFQGGGRLRGASTLTMQLARNLFLWPGGGFVRKGAEAPLALAIDALWPKRRIMEVYLNVVEWAPGVYGAEAAAQHHFGVSAARLDRRQASLLAAVLPSPLNWSAGRPGSFVSRRAETISGRVGRLGGLLGCLD